jgi:hypothetical protein
LVYASERPGSVLPDETQIEELVGRHYKNLGLYKLDLSPGKFFNTWVRDQASAILVSGSYGRSGLSQLFKKSVITDVIRSHRLPIFIAHK